LPKEQVITVAPLAVFEILSPEDRMDRVLRKLSDYESMGIGTIVLIEPKDSSIWRYNDGRLYRNLPDKIDGSLSRMDWSVIRTYLE
jgi:Uma2 family endonuclease